MIRALVTDLNGSFAAMEQHYDPELRGRPVAVCPVLADTGCVVAASREAKIHGVKCGVLVADARRMCPDLHVMQATPGLYVSYQNRMREIVEEVLPVLDVPSIDEFRFRLIGSEAEPARARELALEMKRRIRQEFAPCVTMSIGVAPNLFLAKVATEIQKVDGLTILTDDDLPHALHVFPDVTSLVGINRRMKVRLNAEGIFTVADLTSCSKERLQRVWGTVVGERWFHQLRGDEVDEVKTRPGSLGHSHVLPRDLRNRAGVKAISLRLLGKAAARLRSKGYWACGLALSVSGRQSWERHQRIPETQDDRDLVPLVVEWLAGAEYAWPLKVSVLFYDFRTREAFTPSLFADDPEIGRPETAEAPHEPSRFGTALDRANDEYGKHKVYLARIDKVRKYGVEKIAFQKRELFREGRDDVLPAWDRRPHDSPVEALLRAVESGTALTRLAAYRRDASPPDPGAELHAWEPVEEEAFARIAECVRASLGEREFRLHRGETRRIVVRLLRRVGFPPIEAEAVAGVVFRAVDAGPIPTDPPPDLFHDEREEEESERGRGRRVTIRTTF